MMNGSVEACSCGDQWIRDLGVTARSSHPGRPRLRPDFEAREQCFSTVASRRLPGAGGAYRRSLRDLRGMGLASTLEGAIVSARQSVQRLGPLIGRSRELAALTELLQAAERGRG